MERMGIGVKLAPLFYLERWSIEPLTIFWLSVLILRQQYPLLPIINKPSSNFMNYSIESRFGVAFLIHVSILIQITAENQRN